MKPLSDKIHAVLMNGILIVLAVPVLFAKWLLLDGKFSHGKAIIFVIALFLFGSAFFFS